MSVDALKRIRLANNIGLVGLALTLGCNWQDLRDYESNPATPPPDDLLQRWTAVLSGIEAQPRSPKPDAAKKKRRRTGAPSRRTTKPPLLARLAEPAPITLPEPEVNRSGTLASVTARLVDRPIISAAPRLQQSRSPGPSRAEELGVIERFLAERGATPCPGVGTLQEKPLATLIFDKHTKKWFRPKSSP